MGNEIKLGSKRNARDETVKNRVWHFSITTIDSDYKNNIVLKIKN